jgi:hypothetical protein
VAYVAEQIFGHSHDAVHMFCDDFGLEIVDRVLGVLQDYEVQLVVAVVAVRQHLLELVLAWQSLRKLSIIFIKKLDYLLQTGGQTVPKGIRIINYFWLFRHGLSNIFYINL